MGVNNYIDLSFYLKKLGNHEQSIDARVWDEGSDENAILHDQELLRGLRAELPRWPTFLQREAVPAELRHERDRQLLDYGPTPAEHDEQRSVNHVSSHSHAGQSGVEKCQHETFGQFQLVDSGHTPKLFLLSLKFSSTSTINTPIWYTDKVKGLSG